MEVKETKQRGKSMHSWGNSLYQISVVGASLAKCQGLREDQGGIISLHEVKWKCFWRQKRSSKLWSHFFFCYWTIGNLTLFPHRTSLLHGEHSWASRLRVGGPADWQAVTGDSQSVIPDKPRLWLNVVEQWIQWLETEWREPEKLGKATKRKATSTEQEVFSLFRASSIMLGETGET